jgi:hypothetical protein
VPPAKTILDRFERDRNRTPVEETLAEFESLRSGQRRRIGRRDYPQIAGDLHG